MTHIHPYPRPERPFRRAFGSGASASRTGSASNAAATGNSTQTGAAGSVVAAGAGPASALATIMGVMFAVAFFS